MSAKRVCGTCRFYKAPICGYYRAVLQVSEDTGRCLYWQKREEVQL